MRKKRPPQPSDVVRPGALVVVDDCEADPHHPFFAEYKPVGMAWRHAIGEGTVVGLPDVCGHVALCLGHYPGGEDNDNFAGQALAAGAASKTTSGDTSAGKNSGMDQEQRLPPDESVQVIFTTPKHKDVLVAPASSSSPHSDTSSAATSTGGLSSSAPVVRSHVVVSVAVDLGVGRAADAVRAAPNEWRLCCQASLAEVGLVSSTVSAGGDAATTTASTSPMLPPTCVSLGLEKLPAIPLPGRSAGPIAASQTPTPSTWHLEAWFERVRHSEHLGPRAIVGLIAIEVTG